VSDWGLYHFDDRAQIDGGYDPPRTVECFNRAYDEISEASTFHDETKVVLELLISRAKVPFVTLELGPLQLADGS
jgi:hypothetical protein